MSTTPTGQDLDALLGYLERTRGFDFRGYKRASLGRRVEKRMRAVDAPGVAEYIGFLEGHPDELAALFDTVLINVTHFFRDEDAWDALSAHVLPELLRRRPAGAPIRVWSAGCASGEEAYTVAIVLAELLGEAEYGHRVRIYATDVDEEALARARLATYDERQLAEVRPALVERYFDVAGGSYVVKREWRRQVIFGRHNLLQDAPISHVDLLVCRNVLIYFDAETQERILARFHFALDDGGVLFLGRAETLLTRDELFAPLDLEHRISVRIPRDHPRPRERHVRLVQQEEPDGDDAAILRLREAALDAAPVAQIAVDAAGVLVAANARARRMLGIAVGDVGRSLWELHVSLPSVELRSLLARVSATRTPLLVRDVEWTTGGEPRWHDLQLVPLLDAGAVIGTSVSFADATAAKRLHRDLAHTSQELEIAYEELEGANEELTRMHRELRRRGDELDQLHGFLDSVLATLRGGVVLLDRDARVLAWNERASDLWGLREEEVLALPFPALAIGLPLDRLEPMIRACLAADGRAAETELAATDRRGRSIRCRVACTPLRSAAGEPDGVIVLMEEVPAGDDVATPRASRR